MSCLGEGSRAGKQWRFAPCLMPHCVRAFHRGSSPTRIRFTVCARSMPAANAIRAILLAMWPENSVAVGAVSLASILLRRNSRWRGCSFTIRPSATIRAQSGQRQWAMSLYAASWSEPLRADLTNAPTFARAHPSPGLPRTGRARPVRRAIPRARKQSRDKAIEMPEARQGTGRPGLQPSSLRRRAIRLDVSQRPPPIFCTSL